MNAEQALANLTAAQDRAEPLAKAQRFAQERYDRSRSKANAAALIEARTAFEAALAECDAAHEAYEAALKAERRAERVAKVEAGRAAQAAAQPSLF